MRPNTRETRKMRPADRQQRDGKRSAHAKQRDQQRRQQRTAKRTIQGR